jgi:carbon storage regulator CsrA
MLVLTRKPNEQIRVGDDVVITILRVKGQAVRIGIEAPPEVSLLRGELTKFETPPDAEPATGKRASSAVKLQTGKPEFGANAKGQSVKATARFDAAQPGRLSDASAFGGSVRGPLRRSTSGFDAAKRLPASTAPLASKPLAAPAADSAW